MLIRTVCLLLSLCLYGYSYAQAGQDRYGHDSPPAGGLGPTETASPLHIKPGGSLAFLPDFTIAGTNAVFELGEGTSRGNDAFLSIDAVGPISAELRFTLRF